MLRELAQELSNTGLMSRGQISSDFYDFRDLALDFAENHNFNKTFVETVAENLKSSINSAEFDYEIDPDDEKDIYDIESV